MNEPNNMEPKQKPIKRATGVLKSVPAKIDDIGQVVADEPNISNQK